MTQEIKPAYVTFEQAKLLKEKGFDELTTVWRQHGNGISGDVEGKRDYYNRKGDVYVSLPEQWQVVEWLKVNHGIWVYVVGGGNNRYYPMYQDKNQYKLALDLDKCYDTPQKAYSAAFDYILNDLI